VTRWSEVDPNLIEPAEQLIDFIAEAEAEAEAETE